MQGNVARFHHAPALGGAFTNEGREFAHPFLHRLLSRLKQLGILLVTSQQISAVITFERCNVVFNDTAQTFDLEGVRTDCVLMVIPQCDEQESPGQEDNNDHGGAGAGQKFVMKMLRSKQPRQRSQ